MYKNLNNVNLKLVDISGKKTVYLKKINEIKTNSRIKNFRDNSNFKRDYQPRSDVKKN